MLVWVVVRVVCVVMWLCLCLLLKLIVCLLMLDGCVCNCW